MLRPILFLTFFGFAGFITAQSDTLRLSDTHYGYDEERKLLLTHLNVDSLTDDYGVVAMDSFSLFLPAGSASLRYDTVYSVLTTGGDTIALYFTRLPLIKLRPDTVLNADTKVPATFSYANGGRTVESVIGIEFRGSFSLRFPKKSFDLEFWEDAEDEESIDVTFGNLREDDDWVLDALYNEPLRVNSYVAHKLWLDQHTLYYQEEEEEAKAGADVKFVEVFLDDAYHGLYLLSEQVDRKQLKLKKTKDGEVRGELYKGDDGTATTRFEAPDPAPAPTSEVYDGWELKYPDAEDPFTWDGLFELTDFVANASDSAFNSGVADRFHLPSIRDFFLFLNVASLNDNDAKNTYLARYREDEPYIIIPWDLDVAFGNRFDGEPNLETDFWIANNLQRRLLELSPDRYVHTFCATYDSLRQDIYAPDSLIARLDRQINYLRDNGVYGRETLRWAESVDGSETNADFHRTHIRDRIAYLDVAVCDFATSLSTAPAPAQFRLYPNPADERLYLRPAGEARRGAFALYDLAGRQLMTGRLLDLEAGLDVSALPSGMYLFQSGSTTVPFVVSR